MNKAAQAYFQTKVSTTDQGQLLLLLYDGALKFLQQAREKMLEKDYAAKGILISKVIDIVNELSGTLNLDKGGTLAENLNNLYFLCTTRLLQANLKMNVQQLDSVADILSGLRGAYAQIINTPEAQKISAQIAAKINSEASMSQRGAHLTSTVQPMPSPIGQLQARAAYGQINRSMDQPAAQAASPAALTAPAPTPPPAPSQTNSAVAAAMPSSAAASPDVQPQTATQPAEQPLQPVAAAQASPSPVPPPTGLAQGLAPGGFSRRMASYGKM